MDFGKREGYTIGARPLLQGKHGGLFCFSSAVMKYDPRTAAILEFLTPHLHLALCKIFNSNYTPGESVALSAREKEVLDWLKQGKSSWEISVILNISERTANFHVCNIMRKLGATNRAQAIAVAARLGLIDVG
jgi:DNA-binding CsgD family transcriptional regulator